MIKDVQTVAQRKSEGDMIDSLEEQGHKIKQVVADHSVYRAFAISLGKPQGHYQELKSSLTREFSENAHVLNELSKYYLRMDGEEYLESLEQKCVDPILELAFLV